jgi:hypothetical protein
MRRTSSRYKGETLEKFRDGARQVLARGLVGKFLLSRKCCSSKDSSRFVSSLLGSLVNTPRRSTVSKEPHWGAFTDEVDQDDRFLA